MAVLLQKSQNFFYESVVLAIGRSSFIKQQYFCPTFRNSINFLPQVFGVSNLIENPVLNLGFDVDVIYPTDKGYTRPGEEIVFEFIIDKDWDERVIYKVGSPIVGLFNNEF